MSFLTHCKYIQSESIRIQPNDVILKKKNILNFVFSKEATKIDEIFTDDLTLTT